MTMKIRYLGHSAFALEHDGRTVLIDPFLTGNPKAAVSAGRLSITKRAWSATASN